ncbi:hypothetical protein OK016_25160 [Vibrio chagasii]|nr:hypothetical protein [Vibrio chagasii]
MALVLRLHPDRRTDGYSLIIDHLMVQLKMALVTGLSRLMG